MAESVKLHTCPFPWYKAKSHSCWRVRSALEDMGVAYEIVKEPGLPRSRRKELQRLSGQLLLPVIEFEDGTTYREESAEMAARIRAGKLFEGRGTEPAG
jgi:hypothetical protein